MRNTKFWWRLELLPSGKVKSCTRVERQELEDGSCFIYVQARDQAEAGRRAFTEYCRIKTAARRAKLAAKGECRCGRKNDRAHLGKACCTICSKQGRVHADRRKAKVRGEPFPAADREASIAARKEEKRQDILAAATPQDFRREVLLEVHKAWTSLPNNGRFTAWLLEQIEAAGGKRVA